MNTARKDSLRYGIISATVFALALPPLLMLGTYILHGQESVMSKLNDFIVNDCPLIVLWSVAAFYVGYAIRSQYLATVANFVDEHKELPSDLAHKFGAESFRKLLAAQLYGVFFIMPPAHYLLYLQWPDSIEDFIFIILFEGIAVWLYIYKDR